MRNSARRERQDPERMAGISGYLEERAGRAARLRAVRSAARRAATAESAYFATGMTRGRALEIFERAADAGGYDRFWGVRTEWWKPRRQLLLGLLSPRLKPIEARALSDLLFNRVDFDCVVAFLGEHPRPEDWLEDADRATEALDAARASGAWRPLGGASLDGRAPAWFWRAAASRRSVAA